MTRRQPMSSLKKWDVSSSKLADAFIRQFSTGEIMRSWKDASGIASPANADYEVRHNISLIASVIDEKGLAFTSPYIMQNDAQTHAIIVDIRNVYQTESGIPVLDLQYIVSSRQSVAIGLNAVQTLMRKPGSSGAMNIRTTVEEQTIFSALLAQNAVDSPFVLSPPTIEGMRSSYLTVVDRPEPTIKFPPKPAKACSACGETGPGRLVCSRCRSAYYCSQACQTTHWKSNHKEVCKEEAIPVGADPSTNSVVLGVVVPNDDSVPAEVRLSGRILTTMSTMSRDLDRTHRMNKLPVNIHGDGDFIVKVQVPLGGRGPLMMYDATKSFQRMIYDGEPAHRPLMDCVKRNAHHFQGTKLYLNARREAANFRVFVAPLPSQKQRW